MFEIADYKIESINDNLPDLIPNNIEHIGATNLWNEGYKGEDVVIGVLDTGISTSHYCLKDNILKGKNFTSEGNSDNFEDLNGHGTHVSSIICARPDGEHLGIYGVAPNAKLVVGKVLNKKGNGNIEWITNGLKYMIEEKVDIINMSLGTNVYDKELDKLIELAIDNDILCCVASGNEGDGKSNTNEISYPAYLNNSIAVGAISIDDKITKFSNSNDEIDLVAPGYSIRSCYLNNKFATASGTSQASPHVAGFLALLKQKFKFKRGRNPSEMELYAELIKHCRDLNLDFRFQGNGVIHYE